ncbi:MAG: trigger factor [Gemmataceae bacterium]|nr:trigger factor [Gemmataceae bacterium]
MTEPAQHEHDEPHVHGDECDGNHGEGGHSHGGPEEKLSQTVDIKDVGPCRKHIKVTIAKADIEKALNEKYKELMGDSWVPGFRPGKAPRQIVVRKYKKEVGDQVKGQILYASLEQLAEDFDVAPLSPPNLNPAQLVIPDDADFIYEFEVEVRPQFDLPEYKGIKLKRPSRTFSDADVEAEEKKTLASFGQLIPKEGAADKGDFIVVDMVSMLGDQKVGEAKELTLRVDDTLTFKDAIASNFGEKTTGVKAGEKRTVDMQMTEAVANEALRGQTVQATLEVKDVKSLRLPELTEDFLQANFGVPSVEQFREKVRLFLERRLEYNQRQSAREQVLSHISASATWDLPRDMLMRQARKALQRRVIEMKEAGMSEEEISGRRRMLERDVLNSTALALKEHFVLQKIAETEKIEIEDDEIQAEIERIADMTGESPRRVRAQYEKEEMIETLAAQLIERKALNLILESATYEETEATIEGGMANVDAQAIPGESKDPTAVPDEAKEEQPAAQS